jgi:hypothetical protein
MLARGRRMIVRGECMDRGSELNQEGQEDMEACEFPEA